MSAYRRANSIAVAGAGSTWVHGLNLPPEGAAPRGHVEVVSEDCVVAVRAVTVIDTDETYTYHGLAVPGYPVYVPIDRYGTTVEVRSVRLTTFEHDSRGTPSAVAATAGRIAVRHRPDLGVPARTERRFAAFVQRLGQLFQSSSITLTFPMGPPGNYRIDRFTAYRITGGAAPSSTSFTFAAVEFSRTLALPYVEYNAASRAIGSHIQVPTTQTVYGDQPRLDYSRDGWASAAIGVTPAPAADELYGFRAAFTYLGPAEGEETT